jgi:hypothetical protein
MGPTDSSTPTTSPPAAYSSAQAPVHDRPNGTRRPPSVPCAGVCSRSPTCLAAPPTRWSHPKKLARAVLEEDEQPEGREPSRPRRPGTPRSVGLGGRDEAQLDRGRSPTFAKHPAPAGTESAQNDARRNATVHTEPGIWRPSTHQAGRSRIGDLDGLRSVRPKRPASGSVFQNDVAGKACTRATTPAEGDAG